ncbi:retrovirus-related pol polyprotein from transposon TNT 1-94 [Tanacetum coccineum]
MLGTRKIFSMEIHIFYVQAVLQRKDDIYSTVDACKTANEMWIAIERLQQGESLNVQDVKTNLFWEFGKFTSRDGESMESYYSRDPKQLQRDKDMQNNLALLAKVCQGSTNLQQQLRTSSNSRVKSSPVVQHGDYSALLQGDLATMQGFRKPSGLKTIVSQGKDDDVAYKLNKELEAHYNFMAKIQEVLPEESSSYETGHGKGQSKMKSMVILDLKVKERKDIDKLIEMTQTLTNNFANPKGVNHTTSVSRPQLKCYQVKDKVVPNNSQVKFKKKEVEDHHRISSISKKTKSVTACNDSLNSRTSNVNVVCAECGKCVFNSNHDACVSRYLNDVNARTKKPNVVPISASKPKRKANKSVATPHKKIVASDTTIQKSKSYYKELFRITNLDWKCKKKSFKSKVVSKFQRKAEFSSHDLRGSMRIASINGKKYILVIVDDYSRYTLTLFLQSKDETLEVLKDFLTMIQCNLQAQVISVRTDRDT